MNQSFIKASFLDRFIVSMIDCVFIFFIAILLDKLFGLAFSNVWIESVIYNVIFIAWRGATPGKTLLKIKVVKTDYNKVGIGSAVLRETLGKGISSIFSLGYLTVLLDRKKRAWHDRIAQTFVVKLDKSGTLISGEDTNVTNTSRLLFGILLLPNLTPLFFLFVYIFIASPFQINGQSMAPNFRGGEYVLSDKLSYKIHSPERGDVVVFHAPAAAGCPPNVGCDFIKRIVGLPSETILFHGNQLYVNDHLVEEKYLSVDSQTGITDNSLDKSFILASDEYFVLGDNRPYSSDSRAWGPIKKSDIVGKVFFRYWPLNVSGDIQKPSYKL